MHLNLAKVLTATFTFMAALATAATFAVGPTTAMGVVSAGAAGILAGLALLAGHLWWLDSRDEHRHQEEMRRLADRRPPTTNRRTP